MGIFRKASRAINQKMIEVQSGLVAENAKGQSKLARFKAMGLTAVCLSAIFTTSALAADFSDVRERVSYGLKSVFDTLRIVALPVGVVSLVACGLFYFFGGEKGMETGKKWGARILIGLGLVGLAPLLIETGYNLFKVDETGGVFK